MDIDNNRLLSEIFPDPLLGPREIRKAILGMIHRSGSSHIGSCFSAVDILWTLYFSVLNIQPNSPKKEDRDIFILSKAHASAALYATLAARGFFPIRSLNGYYNDGGTLPGHLDREKVAGLEQSGGSLGHGLSIGIGCALARRFRVDTASRVFILLGDGECNEGSVWEGAMLAGSKQLSNLTVIIDLNGLQGFGKTKEIINQENLAESWKSFGWDVESVDGHDVDALKRALTTTGNKPRVIIAQTVKGKGVSFMENRLEWHYKSPDDEQYAQALQELESVHA